jgi:hypothetical protein
MTREEEIENAWMYKHFQSNHRYDEKTFREAVEWADKTIIDKACDWLLKGGYFVNNTETINDFKRAMEE